MTHILSRRDWLKRAGLASVAAAAVPPAIFAPGGSAAAESATASPELAQAVAPATAREAFENLTAAESDILEAIVARLIPTDANGPGATEARAAHYIDRALGGALKASREGYRTGLAALDRYARSSRGAPFVQLSPAVQDSVLIDVETGAATFAGAGFVGSSGAFFNMVLNHTHQGTFGDPYYGGNVNFVGWDLIGYPGVRTMVTAEDQARLETHELEPNHRSAYDTSTFTKASAQKNGVRPHFHHGD